MSTCVYTYLHVSTLIYMYLHLSTCVYMCLCLSTCVYIYMCLHVYTLVYMCLHLSTCVYTCLHVSTCVFVCLHVSTCVDMCITHIWFLSQLNKGSSCILLLNCFCFPTICKLNYFSLVGQKTAFCEADKCIRSHSQENTQF